MKLSQEQRAELAACRNSPAHFLDNYGSVYDATLRDWLGFKLWPAQGAVLVDLQQHRLTVIVKARQLGLSWLVTGWALWLMLFRPAATVLVLLLILAYLAVRTLVYIWQAPRRLGEAWTRGRAKQAGKKATQGYIALAEGRLADEHDLHTLLLSWSGDRPAGSNPAAPVDPSAKEDSNP